MGYFQGKAVICCLPFLSIRRSSFIKEFAFLEVTSQSVLFRKILRLMSSNRSLLVRYNEKKNKKKHCLVLQKWLFSMGVYPYNLVFFSSPELKAPGELIV